MQTKYYPAIYEATSNSTSQQNRFKLWDYIAFIFSIAFSYTIANALVNQNLNPWLLLFFTVSYSALILVYVKLQRNQITKESMFWLVLVLIASISNVVFPNNYMLNLQTFFIFSVSVYWGASMMKGLLLKATSNYFLLDLINIFILVPLLNIRIVKNFLHNTLSRQKHHSKVLLQVGLGLVISVPLMLFVVPLLIRADASSTLTNFFQSLPEYFQLPPEFITIIGLSIIISIIMFSFLLGYSKQNKLFTVKQDYFDENKALLRVLPMSSAITAWVIILAIYLFFILAQVSYLFSAFSGKLPAASNLIYSSYARQGFFELCFIALVNLMLILMTEIMTDKRKSFMIYFYVTISIITCLLSVTALSKLALYINVYGLTPDRIISTSFVLYLVLVWIGIAVRQFKSFSILRYALMIGAVIVLMLCLLQIDQTSLMINQWLFK